MKRSGLNKGWRQLAILSALLAVCLSLMIGFAWARYQTSDTQNLYYAVKKHAPIFLNGQNYWETVGEQKVLAFRVRNGTGDTDCAEEDQRIFIRLIVGPGAQSKDGELQISLDIEETGECVPGTVSAIVEGSPLHETFGHGWVVTFADHGGSERSWTLQGGELSELSAQLTIWNAEIQNAALMQLQVTGDTAVG